MYSELESCGIHGVKRVLSMHEGACQHVAWRRSFHVQVRTEEASVFFDVTKPIDAVEYTC